LEKKKHKRTQTEYLWLVHWVMSHINEWKRKLNLSMVR